MMLDIDTRLLDLHLHAIPRVGQLTARKLATEIATIAASSPEAVRVEDLLRYLPMRYEDRSKLDRITDLSEGKTASLEVQVRLGRIIPLKGGRLKLYEFVATDGEGEIRAFWWNQIFLAKVFHNATRVILYGQWKWNRSRAMFEVENPEFEVLDDDDLAEANARIHTARRVPIYRKLGDFRTRQLRSIFHHLLSQLDLISEILPAATIKRKGLLIRDEAFRRVHFPEVHEAIELYNAVSSQAHRRLIFEEFFLLTLALAVRRGDRKREPKGAVITMNEESAAVLASVLPFELTRAQRSTLDEIITDMTGSEPMNRLLQGDVGSGKTIVALEAMILAVENGFQAALMAPTEILAEQHARNITNMLRSTRYRVGLLTGSLRASDKREMQERIANGDSDIVIGTHALIQEGVSFKALALAVVDEQHRFGVVQRAELRRRGLNPDVLVMTATPIPRSLAMTVYGDLEVSIIDELPPGRTPVKTFIRGEDRREKIYEFIRAQVAEGRQVYIVYPIIEESEKLDLRNATEMYEHLSSDVFAEFRLGLLHGRMKAAQKEEVMRSFEANEIQVLVATTVIEVGVDVPNATVMVIEHAERFGLSQLHQLRGRVGRGAGESFCILLTQYEQTEDARERLKIMEETSDGFKIAEKDLEIRGMGEILGTRQHGMPAFRVANIVRDQKILSDAKDEVERMLPRKELKSLIVRVRSEPRYGLARVG